VAAEIKVDLPHPRNRPQEAIRRTSDQLRAGHWPDSPRTRRRPSHTAPIARFRNELEDYMAEDQADETLKTIVSWARYAELFAYDETAELFSLENPH